MKKSLLLLLFFFTAGMLMAQTVGSWYYVKPGTSAKVVGIKSDAAENMYAVNASLGLWTNTQAPAQQWQLVDAGNDMYYLKSAFGGYYMAYLGTLKAGAKIVTRDRTATACKWVLQPVEGKTNVYRLLNSTQKFCIGFESTSDGVVPALVAVADATDATANFTLTEITKNVFTEYNGDVRDAIVKGFMDKYYKKADTGYVLGGGGWWGDAEMIETLLDAFETTGDKTYQTQVSNLISNFISRNGSDWTAPGGWPRYNEFNDDITWMVLALVRSYKYFGTTAHLKYAQNNFDKMYARALEPGGTLRWKEASDTKYGSNSCINGPAIVAACYLYEMTGDEGYLEKAKNLYAAQRKYLFEASTGKVFDSGSWNADYTKFTIGNYWCSTYNQGTMLGSAVKLYHITREAQYKTDADRIWNFSAKDMCNSDSIVHACQTAVGDLCGFKGILMRYSRLYAEEFGIAKVKSWLKKNAWYAYQNRNSKGVIWSKWLRKTSENFKSQEGEELKDFNNDPFGASTAVSAAVNVHINGKFKKSAADALDAEYFDDIHKMQIASTKNDGDTPNTTSGATGAYICFKNVSFGSAGSDCVVLRTKASSDDAHYSIYIDKIDDANLVATSATLSKEWSDNVVNFNKVTGTHHVYFVNTGSSSVMFHQAQFTTADGVGEVENYVAPAEVDAIFSIDGKRLDTMQPGINIVRYTDGSSKKVMR